MTEEPKHRLQIHIKFVSETAPGSGNDDAGLVDRDVTLSRAGLPILPARRLKGCLREAALDVVEAAAQVGGVTTLSRTNLDMLFGKQGGLDGVLHLVDAHLPEAPALEEWLAWANSKSAQHFTTASVGAVYTGTRSQTAIDTRTGAARTNTLRTTRVIQRGVELVARVGPAPYSDELRDFLAVACAALRHIGLARNRGLGNVRVWLADESGTNYTENVLNRLEKEVA